MENVGAEAFPRHALRRVADKMVEDEIKSAGSLVPGCEAALAKVQNFPFTLVITTHSYFPLCGSFFFPSCTLIVVSVDLDCLTRTCVKLPASIA